MVSNRVRPLGAQFPLMESQETPDASVRDQVLPFRTWRLRRSGDLKTQ